MTAQTPASKASGVSALLASLSTVPPMPQPPAKEDFLAVILQALMAQPGGADGPPPVPSAKEAQKPSSTEAAAPDPSAASLLLAGLAPPFPTTPQLPARKVSGPTVPVVPSAPPTQPATGQTTDEANSAKQKPSSTEAAALDPIATSLLLAWLALPLPMLPQLSARKASAPSVPAVPSSPPAQAPPPQTAAETKPAETAAEKSPLAQILTPQSNEPDGKPQPPVGTSVANTSQRMNLVPERNEIAGRIEQKLPPTAISAISSADTGGPSPDGGTKSSLTFSWHDAPPETVTINDLSTQTVSPAAPVAEAIVDAPARDTSAAPVERLEKMISHEVLTIRQTGAETLGVSLKLDSNTQLFLQLTTHNGSVQASVRCERGNFAPEDAQWAQLQQSLARQNVALQPMTGGSNLSFQQPSGENPRRPAAAREDWAAAGEAAPPAQPRQQKEQNRSRRNWESWA